MTLSLNRARITYFFKIVFIYLLLFCLLLLFFEAFDKGLISKFVNLNLFLLAVAFWGAIAILLSFYNMENNLKTVFSRKIFYFTLVLVGVLGSTLVYIKLRAITNLDLFLAIVCFLLIIFMGHLIYNSSKVN